MTTSAAGRQEGYTIEALPFRWTAGQMSMALTVLALVLWTGSIVRAEYETGYYGLISSFPVTYFIALGLLTLASAVLWVSRERHDALLFLQLAFLIVSIWAMPIAIGGASSPEAKTYADIGFIEYVVRTGHFNPADAWQHNWPIAWAFWAGAMELCGISVDGMTAAIPWLPFLWQCALLVPMFLFFRNMIGADRMNYCWAAMWFFYLGSWFETQNTGAQAFGVFYFFSLLALLTTPSEGRQAVQSMWHLVSATIILAASALAHLLGSMVTLAATAGLVVSRRVRERNLVLMALLFIIVWSVYGAMSYFGWRIPRFLELGFRIDRATGSGLVSPFSGSEAHAAVALVRFVFSGLLLALAVLGGLLGWRSKHNRYADITMLAIVAGCGVAAVVVGAGYRHELYQRFFVFLLPALTYFGVKLLRVKPAAALLVLALAACPCLTLVAKYGNQDIDYLSRSYRSGADYFQERTVGGHLIAELPVGRMANYGQYHFAYSHDAYEDVQREGDHVVLNIDTGQTPQYVCISNHDRAEMAYFWDEPQIIDEVEDSLASNTDFNLVYINNGMSLYVHELQ